MNHALIDSHCEEAVQKNTEVNLNGFYLFNDGLQVAESFRVAYGTKMIVPQSFFLDENSYKKVQLRVLQILLMIFLNILSVISIVYWFEWLRGEYIAFQSSTCYFSAESLI